MGRYTPAGHGRRNFGFGQSMRHAMRNAIRDMFAGGHFATVDAYVKRCNRFLEWAEEATGIRDTAEVSRETLQCYAADLSEDVGAGTLAVSYAQVRLSAVNVVLEYMRGDRKVWLSPSEAVGQRSYLRTEPPMWMERAQIQVVVDALFGEWGRRVAATIWLAREWGLRWRECALLNAGVAVADALARGEIRIVRGTKGGHPRIVPVSSDRQLDALRVAVEVQDGKDNLIPAQMSYRHYAHKAARIFYGGGGQHFHHLRAAYACERYEVFSGWAVPVLGGVILDRAKDGEARRRVSEELGHHRVQVVAAYIGGRQSVAQ